MKKISSFLLAAILFLSASSFAHTGEPSAKIQSEFKLRFTNAENIKWSAVSDLYKADFAQEGLYLSVFLDADGKMVSVSRNIDRSTLPLLLGKKLEDKFKAYWLSELFEVNDSAGVSYYATLQNANEEITLSSDGNYWSVYKKIKKDLAQ